MRESVGKGGKIRRSVGGRAAAMRAGHPAAALQRLADGAAGVRRAAALQRLADARGAATGPSAATGPLQRAADEEDLMQGMRLQRMEEEEPLQGKLVQRALEEEEPMQGKAVQTAAGPGAASAAAHGGLPAGLRAGVERLSGQSLGDVRVRRDSPDPARVGALAYAQGRDIHVGPGQEAHLPHEAWHVVQQAQGRVQPTTEVAGAPVNDDAGLEREADVMGARAAQFARETDGAGMS